MRRGVAAAVPALLVVCALAGCGSTVVRGGPQEGGATAEATADAPARQRAAEVAAAWPGSAQEKAWRSGYYPVGVPAEWLPPDAFHSGTDKDAYQSGRLVLAGGLPQTFSGLTQVRWADGSQLTLPLRSADAVFRSLTEGRPACNGTCGQPLTVTGAEPGTREVATSRGRAEIPVWRFRIAGYADPFTYPAVESQQPPSGPPEDVRGARSASFAAVSADGRTVTAGVAHGGCERVERTEAYETGAAVVLIARVRSTARPGTACDAALHVSPERFRLAGPLDGRVVLDLATGAPQVPTGAVDGGPARGR
ncbi:hypothetical protein [Kitasatospora sp. NPDC093679]|uniref:hypothetical protein n=1 Tax=Kitasatospora sp. NPDC093679 TaxID=3154983 RepID=UPI00342D908B